MEGKLEKAVLLIERYLSQIFGSIRVYREDREFLIPWGSTVINVDVIKEEDDLFVHIYSPVALKVKPDKDLTRFLLMENASLKMCSFYIELEKGLIDIILGIKIKFDFLNKEILRHTTICVGNLANEYSKEIIAVFGGMTFKEYVEREKMNRRPFGEEKVLHDIFSIEGLEISLELYRTPEESYLIVGKIKDTGQVFLRAERKRDIKDVFDLLEKIKELMIKKDVAMLRKMLKHYEVEDTVLYSILAGRQEDKIKKLREIEREIQFLTELLMKGEISHEEYQKRMSDIERLFGL